MLNQSLQKWAEIKKIVDITSDSRESAIWQVTYVGSKIYLTTEEKEFLLAELEKGAKYINIKDQVLTGGFISILVNPEMKEQSRYKDYEETKEEERFWDNLRYDCPKLARLKEENKITDDTIINLYNGGTITDKSGKKYSLEDFKEGK